MRSGSHGLAAAGVVTPKASSCVAVLPVTTVPASRSRATSGASCGVGSASGTLEPPRVDTPAVDDVLDGPDAVQRPAGAALGELATVRPLGRGLPVVEL